MKPQTEPSAPAVASDPDSPPELSGYRLDVPPLGTGPATVVYRGWDLINRCDVAVKVQRPGMDAVAADRFRREATIMRSLHHPNIVALYEFRDASPLALILEFVPGENLGSVVAGQEQMDLERVCEIVEGIAAALDCAHAQGVVHRDVKPGNVLIPPHGPVRLTDFGVAHIDAERQLTVMGDVLGTVEYASPEQLHSSDPLDARADVYSLAAVTYFALIGEPPFRAEDQTHQAQISVMHRQAYSEPPAPSLRRFDLPEGVGQVVLKGLSKSPEDRYQSAGQFAAALRAAVFASQGDVRERAAAAVSRRRQGWGWAAAAAAFAAIGLGIGYRSATQNGQAPAPVAVVSHPHPSQMTPRPPVQVAAVPHSSPGTVHPTTPVHPVPNPPAPVHPAPTASHGTPGPKPPVVAVVPASHPAPAAPTHPASAALVHPAGPAHPVVTHPTAPVHPAPPPAPIVVKRPPAVVHPPAPKPPIAVVKRPTPPKPPVVVKRPAPPKHPVVASHPKTISHAPAPKHPVVVKRPAPPKHPVVVKRPAPPPHPVHPTQVASTGTGTHRTPPAAPASREAWLQVYASQNVSPPGQPPRMEPVPAQAITFDGKPISQLSDGQWARVQTGHHLITFYPPPGSGFDVGTIYVGLSPDGHIRKQVPLPRKPSSSSAWPHRTSVSPSGRPTVITPAE